MSWNAPRMSAGAYEIVAGIVRKIQDERLRLQVADHFCREFHARSQAFDPYAWEKRTGGVLNRKDAE